MVSKVEIVRPDDLLNLDVDAINLRLDLADPADPALVIEDAGQPAYLVVAFPPQTIVEEAYFKSSALTQPKGDPPQSPKSAPGLPTAGQARARIGGTSRLVLRVPPGKRIPYTIEGLLDWRDLELSVSAIADMPEAPSPQQVSAVPGIAPPAPTETSIELPYRLMLSPSHDVAWVHRPDLKVSGGHTELWHTRLAHRDEEGAAKPISRTDPAPLRAIWSPDYNPKRFWKTDSPKMGQPDADWGVLTAMTPSDRHEIVVATSAFHGYIKGIGLGGSAGKPDFSSFLPTPFHAEQLHSLGARWLAQVARPVVAADALAIQALIRAAADQCAVDRSDKGRWATADRATARPSAAAAEARGCARTGAAVGRGSHESGGCHRRIRRRHHDQ